MKKEKEKKVDFVTKILKEFEQKPEFWEFKKDLENQSLEGFRFFMRHPDNISGNKGLKAWIKEKKVIGSGIPEDPYVITDIPLKKFLVSGVKKPLIITGLDHLELLNLRRCKEIKIEKNNIAKLTLRGCSDLKIKFNTFKDLIMIATKNCTIEDWSIDKILLDSCSNNCFINCKMDEKAKKRVFYPNKVIETLK